MRTPPTWMKMSNCQHKHDIRLPLTWHTYLEDNVANPHLSDKKSLAWPGLAFGSHEHGVGVSSPNCTMHRLGRP